MKHVCEKPAIGWTEVSCRFVALATPIDKSRARCKFGDDVTRRILQTGMVVLGIPGGTSPSLGGCDALSSCPQRFCSITGVLSALYNFSRCFRCR